MDKSEFLKEIYRIYLETEEKIKALKEIEVNGNDMIDVDMETYVKAQGYHRIHEMFCKLKLSKEGKKDD